MYPPEKRRVMDKKAFYLNMKKGVEVKEKTQPAVMMKMSATPPVTSLSGGNLLSPHEPSGKAGRRRHHIINSEQ